MFDCCGINRLTDVTYGDGDTNVYLPYFSEYGTVLTFLCEHQRDRYFNAIHQQVEREAIKAFAERLTGDAKALAELMAEHLAPDASAESWRCDCDEWQKNAPKREADRMERWEAIVAEAEAS